MPEPYSNDLRLKVLQACQKHKHTQAEIAELFGVSLSFVEGVLRRFRRENSTEHKPHGGGMPPKLDEEGLAAVKDLSARYPDAVLEELSARFEEERGVRLPTSVLHRALKKLGITRKKSPVARRRQTAPTSRSSAASTRASSTSSRSSGSTSSTKRGSTRR